MKIKFEQPAGLPPGIYLNLPEDKYHEDLALSHGGMVSLLDGGFLTYWIKSPLNPGRGEFLVTKAMEFGTYCHEMLLDEKSFFKKYNCTSGRFDMTKKTLNKTILDNVKESIGEIKRVPEAHEMFKNGYPEVTIIVICPTTGVRLRIRVDWLRIFGGIDYKRAKSIQFNPLGWHIADFGYDIQEALYTDVIAEAKRLLLKGLIKVYDCAPDGKIVIAGMVAQEWFQRFAKDKRTFFRFLFQRSEKPYIFIIMKLDDEIISNARAHIEDAKQIYIKGIAQWGINRPTAGSGKTIEFSNFHLPRRIIDRGNNELE